MGCDIHGVFQAKVDGKWIDVPHGLRFIRDYRLFGALSGTRLPPEGIDPIAESRGLPDDFEYDYREDHPTQPECLAVGERWYWIKYNRSKGKPCAVDMGDHGHSWATGEEMIAWFKIAPDEAKKGLEYFFDEVQELIYSHKEVRFVFGFDS